MKKIILFLVAVVYMLNINAQKPNVITTYNCLNSNPINLDLAKEKIDAAVVFPGTNTFAKAWYYYGRTYTEIYFACQRGEQKYCDVEKNPLNKMLEGYMKGIIFNFKDISLNTLDYTKDEDKGKLVQLVNDPNVKFKDNVIAGGCYKGLQLLVSPFYNDGVAKFEAGEYTKAREMFELAAFVSDLTGTSNPIIYRQIARCYFYNKEYKDALEIYSVLIDANIGKNDQEKVSFYVMAGNCYKGLGDTTSFLNLIDSGMVKFPNEQSLLLEKIDYYNKIGKGDESEDLLKLAIQNDPTNPILYEVLGLVYDRREDYIKAEEYYKKSIEVDSNSFGANANLGILYFNWAADINNKMKLIPIKEYEKIKLANEQSLEMFKKAVPYLEKTLVSQPDDKPTLRMLKEIYFRLEMYDKSNEMKKRLGN